jgi:transcriptional regulator with XRE-family HTH domain
MEEMGISLNDLAKKVDITYEHVRRVVRGNGAPSKFVLKLICEELKLPLREAEKLAMVDKIWGKYGKLLTEYMGQKPGMEPIERVWDKLSEEQKSSIVVMVQSLAKASKAARV